MALRSTSYKNLRLNGRHWSKNGMLVKDIVVVVGVLRRFVKASMGRSFDTYLYLGIWYLSALHWDSFSHKIGITRTIGR